MSVNHLTNQHISLVCPILRMLGNIISDDRSCSVLCICIAHLSCLSVDRNVCVVLLHISDSILWYCVDSEGGDSLLTLTTTGLHRRLARVRASMSIQRLKHPGQEAPYGILNYLLTIHSIVGQHTV